MSDPETIENPERRRFITACFSEKISDKNSSVFERADTIGNRYQGVIWAAEGSKKDELFFAGDDGVVLHFDGDKWQQEALNSDLPIHALCRGNDNTLYAVGWLGLICERRNEQWRIIQGGERTVGGDSADFIRLNLPLFDVATAPSGAVWAVGDQGRIVCSDDQGWQEIDCGVQVNFRCVLPLHDNSILVGGLGGAVLHYSNGQWTQLDTQTACPIVSMTAVGIDNIYAVGGEYSSLSGDFIGRVFHYNGNKWSKIETEHPLPRLRRIRQDENGILIVGDGGTALRIDEEGATQLKTRVRYDLHDVVTTESGAALLCGDGGTVLMEAKRTSTFNNIEIEHELSSVSSWKVIPQDITDKTLRGIWCATPNTYYAVGDAGTVLKYDNETWSLEKVPLDIRLHGIWGTSAGNIYAIGDNATILHFDGKTWDVTYQDEVDSALLAITGFGAHDIFVVGDNGSALRFDGIKWQRMDTGTRYELYALWGYDSTHLLAIGGAGIVIRWNGHHWQTFNAGTDNDIYSVWGESLERIYLCGLSGTLISFCDRAWRKQYTGVRTDLHAIAGSQGGPVFAVGSQGMILQYQDDKWVPEQNLTDATLHALSISEKTVLAVGSGGSVLRLDHN